MGIDRVMALDGGKDVQDALGGGSRAGPILGIDGKRGEVCGLHPQADLALDEGSDQQGNEDEEEQRLDAGHTLQPCGSDQQVGLQSCGKWVVRLTVLMAVPPLGAMAAAATTLFLAVEG